MRKNECGRKMTTIGDVHGLFRDYSVANDGRWHNCSVAFETQEQYNRDTTEFFTEGKYELDDRDYTTSFGLDDYGVMNYYKKSQVFVARETKNRNV